MMYEFGSWAHALRKKIAVIMGRRLAPWRLRDGQNYLSDLEGLEWARKRLHLAKAGKLPDNDIEFAGRWLDEIQEKAEAVYCAALAAASAVLGHEIVRHLDDSIEILLEAAHRLRLDDRWRYDAYEQCAEHEKRGPPSNKAPARDTEDSVRHGIAWAEVVVTAAEEYLRGTEEKAGQGEEGQA